MLENDPTISNPHFVVYMANVCYVSSTCPFFGRSIAGSCQEEEEDGPSDDRLEAGGRTSAIS